MRTDKKTRQKHFPPLHRRRRRWQIETATAMKTADQNPSSDSKIQLSCSTERTCIRRSSVQSTTTLPFSRPLNCPPSSDSIPGIGNRHRHTWKPLFQFLRMSLQVVVRGPFHVHFSYAPQSPPSAAILDSVQRTNPTFPLELLQELQMLARRQRHLDVHAPVLPPSHNVLRSDPDLAVLGRLRGGRSPGNVGCEIAGCEICRGRRSAGAGECAEERAANIRGGFGARVAAGF